MSKGVPRPRETRYPLKRTVALPPDVAARVQALARAHGMSDSAIIREAVKDGLKRTADRLRWRARREGAVSDSAAADAPETP